MENCSVYAFEPNVAMADLLRSNIKLNGLDRRVKVFEVGLSDERKEKVLRIPTTERPGLSTYGENVVRFDAYREVITQVTSLDDFVEEQKITRLDFIKIDTEGAEMEILRGGRRSIQKWRPKLLLEVNEENLKQFGVKKEDLFKTLSAMGYDHRYVSHEDVFCTPRS